MSWHRACRLSDVPAQRGWPTSIGGLAVAVFRDGERLRAVDNACRHTGAPVDDGMVEAGCVTCPWHGWRYELATGDLVTGFGHRRGLRTYPVRIDGDDVFVELPDER